MPDLDTNADHTTSLESRLDAWGRNESAQLVEPSPQFLRAVHAARAVQAVHAVHGPRLARRVFGALALAAIFALVAFVALRPDARPPTQHPGVPGPVAAGTDVTRTARITTAGLGRTADVETILDLLYDQPRPPAAPPARPSDAYCAGCIEELMRI